MKIIIINNIIKYDKIKININKYFFNNKIL